MADVSRSIAEAAAGADAVSPRGLPLSCKLACSAAASFTASPWPLTCMYMVAGSDRSRWL